MIRLKGRLRYLDPRGAGRARWIARTACLADCVSYHGFHYHEQSAHPLQQYALGLARGSDIRALRAQFIEFLRFYRPINAAQAMGLPDLDPALPAWIYPWKRALNSEFRTRRGWSPSPAACSDILTRFCEVGIASYRIEEEWMWAERALHSLRARGYRRSFGCLRAHTLHADDGRVAHLLLDGNHRAAALCAQGVHTVELLSEARWQIRERDVDKWPGVKSGQFSRASALQIFHGFIEGNARPVTTDTPAPILAPPGWTEFYDQADPSPLEWLSKLEQSSLEQLPLERPSLEQSSLERPSLEQLEPQIELDEA